MESEAYVMAGSSLTCQIINNLSVNGYNLNLMPVDYGVPQGYVLGHNLYVWSLKANSILQSASLCWW